MAVDGMMRFPAGPAASPRLGGAPLVPSSTGYPWVDGDILYAADLNAAFQMAYAESADIGRNLLHNPLFNVAQRGLASVNITPASTPVYTADRWAGVSGGDAYGVQVLGQTDANRTQIGDEGAVWLVSCGFTGGAGAGNYCEFMQRIENVRRLAGKTITVSFWANAGASLALGVNVSQSFGLGGSPTAPVIVGAQTVGLSTTWARYSLSFVMPSVSGKAFGTTPNTDNTQLEFWLSSGSTNATRAGVGVQSGTINFWGVQLEVGSVATPLEKPDPRYGLANCQRFYQTGGILGAGTCTAGVQIYHMASLPVTMRAQPTITTVNSSTNITSPTVVAVGAWLNGAVAGSGTATATGAYIMNIAWTASADL